MKMYLVDSNVWLERLLAQERSDEVGLFLDRIASDQLFITDFSLHSIALVFTRLKQPATLERFILDTFTHGAVNIIRLEPEALQNVLAIINHFNLDFDDAYQYVAAEKYNLTLVSFDRDCDRTERGRKTPAEVTPQENLEDE